MNKYTTNAINIKSYNLGESDKIIVMYSKEQGIIRCIAKGIKKATAKLGGRMDLLIANKLLLSKGKNLDIVCQAEGIDNFKELRKDITKLTYSIYCAELIEHFGMENDINSEKIYDLFFNLLKNLASAKNENQTVGIVLKFQLKLMEFTGYGVGVDSCVRCNKNIEENSFVFCAESGGIICPDCKKDLNKYLNCTPEMRNILKVMLKIDFSDILKGNSNSFEKFELDCCFNILKQHISQRAYKKLKSADMIECLC